MAFRTKDGTNFWQRLSNHEKNGFRAFAIIILVAFFSFIIVTNVHLSDYLRMAIFCSLFVVFGLGNFIIDEI